MVPCRISGLPIRDLRCRHDLGNAGLVVGAEQCRAIGGDQIVADLVAQRRMLGNTDDLLRIAGQLDIAAGIGADHLRLHNGCR